MESGRPGEFKYLVANERDLLWGISVTSVGFQRVAPGEEYPSKEHPPGYYFDVRKGRVLDEYQLIYVVGGGGVFATEGRSAEVAEGDMFLVLPGCWHSYRPDPDSGWSVYWIGFRGHTVDERMVGGFFDRGIAVFHVGIHALSVELYRMAVTVAGEQNPCYQQMLSGTVAQLLGIALYREQPFSSVDGEAMDKIARAKILMQEGLSGNISVQEVARRLHVSYSWLRIMFRKVTGMAPVQYVLELKLLRAKELLAAGTVNVKEIAYALNFSSPRYFSGFFKKKTGLSPQQYRERLAGLCRTADGTVAGE